MKKEWVDQKNKESKEKIEKDLAYIIEEVKSADYMSDLAKSVIMKDVKEKKYNILNSDILFAWTWLYENGDYEKVTKNEINEFKKKCKKLAERAEVFEQCRFCISYDDYLDMEKEFDGDILITDPCYFIIDNRPIDCDSRKWNPILDMNEWIKCQCGDNLEVFGIKNYIQRFVINTDWCCTTFNTDTNKELGTFYEGTGKVGIYYLDEVLKYNPGYQYEGNPSVTYIKDFKGTVTLEVKMNSGYYTKEDEYRQKDIVYKKAGTYYEKFYVEVVGHGINKVTGEPINFVGRQSQPTRSLNGRA